MISLTVFTCKMNWPNCEDSKLAVFLTAEFLKKFQAWPDTTPDSSAPNTNFVSSSYTDLAKSC